MQLERQAKGFAERGLGVAAVLREPPALLKAFAERHGVHYPLLADGDAAVIGRFGLVFVDGHSKFTNISRSMQPNIWTNRADD